MRGCTKTHPTFHRVYFAARYLAHFADWGIVSAVSPAYQYIPFGTMQSFADGPLDGSTGVPYFYIAEISDTYKNVQYNNTVSFSMTQAESAYCREKGLDPEEPLCSRVILYGKVKVASATIRGHCTDK